MEYLESITSISNNNNITIIKLTTNKRNKIIRIPYTNRLNSDNISYHYGLSIQDYCNIHNINTFNYFKGII